MTTMRSRRPVILSLSLLLLAVGLVFGTPAAARAATVTEVTFNNLSRASALNADPQSAADVDDVTVGDGGRLFLPASADPEALSGWLGSGDAPREAFTAEDYVLRSTGGEQVVADPDQ